MFSFLSSPFSYSSRKNLIFSSLILLSLILLLKAESDYCPTTNDTDLLPCEYPGAYNLSLYFCCSDLWPDYIGNQCRIPYGVRGEWSDTSFNNPNITYEQEYTFTCSSNIYPSDYCISKCATESSFPCDGDTNFCLDLYRIVGKNCSSSLCNCTTVNFTSHMSVFDQYGNNNSFCNFQLKTVSFNLTTETPLIDLPTDKIKITYDQIKSISIQNKNEFDVYCRLSKDKVIVTATVSNNSASVINIEYQQLIKAGFMNVTCYNFGNHFLKTVELFINSYDYCDSDFFTIDYMINDFSCRTFSSNFVAVIKIVSFFGISATILFLLLTNLKKITCKVVIFSRFVQGFFSNMIRIWSKDSKFRKMSFMDAVKDIYKDSKSGRISIMGFVIKPLVLNVIMAIKLISLLSGAAAISCNNNDIVGGSLTECNSNGLNRTCKLSFSSQFNINDVASSSCFSIVDQDTIIMSINVELLAVQEFFDLDTKYYTSDWDYDFVSSLKCGAFKCDTCPYGQCLNYTNPLIGEVKSCNGQTYTLLDSSKTATFTGRSGCFPTNAFAEPCFGEADCLYYRYVIKPKGSVYSVNRISYKTIKPIIRVTVTDQMGNPTVMVIKQVGQKYYMGNDKKVSFTINGIYDSGTTFTDDIYIVAGNGDASIAAASPWQVPTVGVIGDIQASNAVSLKTPGTNSFAIASDLIKVKVDKAEITFSAANKGFSNFLANRKLMPLWINGNRWIYDYGKIFTNVTQIRTISINMVTEKPINVVFTDPDVVPNANFISTSGCFNCDLGSIVIFDAKSDKDPGFAFVTASDPSITILTKVLHLSQSFQKLNVSFNPSFQKNSFYLILTGKEQSFRMLVQFNAKSGTYNPNRTRQSNTTDDGSSGWDGGIPNIFSGSDNPFNFSNHWISYMIYAAGFVAIVALIVLVVYIYKGFKSPMSSKLPSKKYV